MGNINNIASQIKTRIREVTVTDTATSESKTTVKAVNLKASDFADRAEWRAYSRRLLELAPIMRDAAAAMDSTNGAVYTAARKKAVDAVQGIANLLCNIAGLDKITIQKKDVNYILRLAYARKVDRNGKTISVDVKSRSALQSLVEDVMFFHANGQHVPNVGLTDATQTAIDKMHIADATANKNKAATKKAATKKAATKKAATKKAATKKAATKKAEPAADNATAEPAADNTAA